MERMITLFGYTGKILRVNLDAMECSVDALSPEVARAFLGGRGLGVKILLDELDPQADPLSPENILVIAPGTLIGSSAPTAGRYMAITKSPLNNGVVSTNSGGFWGAELKFAGYDAIVIKGKARSPVYLHIEGEVAQLLDAGEIWGTTTSVTTRYLQEKHEKCKVLNIGPAGENLSRIAAIINDEHRAAGRGGAGAVMGSKNLKAIAVRALEKKVPLANKEALDARVKEILPDLRKNGAGYTQNGTLGIFNLCNEKGVYPTHNFKHNNWDTPEKIDSKALNEYYLVKVSSCYRCPLACGRVSKVDGKIYHGPEYETVWAFGPDCGVGELSHTIIAGHLCNEYGLDVISAGTTIAAAMELYERGYIKDEEVNGPALKWGNAEAVTQWIELMALRKGLGDKMADGSYAMCEFYGVPEYSMSVKKLEMPGYDPRGLQGQGLSYATANRGGCHVTGNVWVAEVMMEAGGGPRKNSTQGKEKLVVGAQNRKTLIDSLGLCGFASRFLTDEDLVHFYNTATGFDITLEEIAQTGDRIYNAERYLSTMSAGYSAKDDVLPPRITDEPISRGPSQGEYNKLSEMIGKYYELRGWDDNGRPTPEKIDSLKFIRKSTKEAVR